MKNFSFNKEELKKGFFENKDFFEMHTFFQNEPYLPQELIGEILQFFVYGSEYSLKECAKTLELLNSRFIKKHILDCLNLVKKLRRAELSKTYTKQHRWILNNMKDKEVGDPILLDILSTGCNLPFTCKSFNFFCDKNGAKMSDIYEIICLFPESINCNKGVLRCRDLITPLYMACTNEIIPEKVVEFLISKGANNKHKILLNSCEQNMWNDLTSPNQMSIERYKKLKPFFE